MKPRGVTKSQVRTLLQATIVRACCVRPFLESPARRCARGRRRADPESCAATVPPLRGPCWEATASGRLPPPRAGARTPQHCHWCQCQCPGASNRGNTTPLRASHWQAVALMSTVAPPPPRAALFKLNLVCAAVPATGAPWRTHFPGGGRRRRSPTFPGGRTAWAPGALPKGVKHTAATSFAQPLQKRVTQGNHRQ